jgi:membrane-associated phospholipid phosphatase
VRYGQPLQRTNEREYNQPSHDRFARNRTALVHDASQLVNFLTDFADEAVMLPLAVAVSIVLLALDWRRGAAAWVIAVGGTLATVVVLKVAGWACGPPLLRTPSGHAAAAAVVCGGLALIVVRRDRPHRALLIGMLAAAVIGVSRLLLGAHSLPEVLVGGAVGIAGAWLLARLAGPPPQGLRARWVAVVVVVVLVLFHGTRLPAETQIGGFAFRLAQELRVCRGAPGWDQANRSQTRPYVSSSRTISSSFR